MMMRCGFATALLLMLHSRNALAQVGAGRATVVWHPSSPALPQTLPAAVHQTGCDFLHVDDSIRIVQSCFNQVSLHSAGQPYRTKFRTLSTSSQLLQNQPKAISIPSSEATTETPCVSRLAFKYHYPSDPALEEVIRSSSRSESCMQSFML